MRPIHSFATTTNSAASSTRVTLATPPTLFVAADVRRLHPTIHPRKQAPRRQAPRGQHFRHPTIDPRHSLAFLAGAQKSSPPSAGFPKHSPTAVSSFACNEKLFANNAAAFEPSKQTTSASAARDSSAKT